MEITNQEVNTEIKYKDSWRENIAKCVSENWNTWDDNRSKQISWIDKINELLDMAEVLEKDEETGKVKQKDVAIRRIYRTIVARLYNSTFKTPMQMFSVDFETGDSQQDNHANYIQKQAILNVLKRAKIKKECLEAIRNLTKAGEAILFVNWKQEFNLVRRKSGFNFNMFGAEIDLRKWSVQRELKYDGVEITNIDPKDIVWDVKANDFDSTLKIIRRWKSYNEIESNEGYKKYLSTEDLKKIKDSVERKNNNSLTKDDDKHVDRKAAYDGNMVEVLECYGDLSVELDNEIQFFPNRKIVVIGREFIGCFEYNPQIVNPIIRFSIEDDLDTGRGISQLSGLIPISIAISDTLNKYHVALGLSIFKHYFCPQNLFKDIIDGKIKLDENGITIYNDTLPDGGDIRHKLVPLEVSDGLRYALEGMEYYKQQQQDETQVYRQSSGDSQQQPQTLGQAKLLQQNQDIVESCDNDLFGDCVVLRLIEIIAEFMANFKDNKETIKYQDAQGKDYTGVIDDEVRQGKYVYSISDSVSTIEKKMTITEYVDKILAQVAPYAASTGQGFISVPELINIIGSAYEQDDPTKILLPMQPQMAGDMNGQPNGMPTDVPIEPTEGLAVPPEQVLQ